MPTVRLGDIDYEVALPDLTTRRDVALAFADSPRRAGLAAIGLCLSLPVDPNMLPIGPRGFRHCKGNVYDFAERVEVVLEALHVHPSQVQAVGREVWTACVDGALPDLVQQVSRVDFLNAGAGRKSSPSASASSTAATRDGSTD